MQAGLVVGCMVLAFLATTPGAALARPMHVLSSTPAAGAVMQGRNAQYVLRFDGPVDHAQSRLEIVRDGHVIQVLHPLLDSATDVLFASAPGPAPGDYVLHWTVKSIPDGDDSEGTIAFSVTQQATR